MCCMTDSDIPVIDSKTLRQKIKENSIRLVDVRREQEYQQGHITNAINLPLAKLLADDLSLIHISEPTRQEASRMPSSA